MSEINALLHTAESRIENLEGDRAWISNNDSVRLEYLKLQAMLLQANETFRLADAVERVGDYLEGLVEGLTAGPR